MTAALSPSEISAALADLAGWSGNEHGIQGAWRFADFPAAIAFMSSCVDAIEGMQHHPEWSNVYNRLTITLKTHDAGDRVTAKDIELASTLNARLAAAGAQVA